MKIINGLVKIIDKLIDHSVWIIILILLFYSGYALYDAHETYQKAKLSEDILKYRPDENEMFSLATIQKEINEDICGWIRIYNTNIDYPIVIGEDNTKYRNNDYKNNYSVTGSIFMDYRNDRYFQDDYTIIYGHNLKKDLMFAEIKNYSNKKYFDNHLTGILYTGDKIYKIEIIYFESINAYSKPYSLMFYKNDYNKELLLEFESNASNKSSIEVSEEDKLILLSTCNSSDTETRSVLIGKLTEIDESEIINEKDSITLNEIDKQLSDREKYENAKSIVKDNENKIVNTKYIIIVTIVVVVLLIIILSSYLKKGKETEKNKKNKGKHMK